MAIQLSSKNLSIVFLDTDLDACFLFQVREVFSCYVFKYVLSPFLSLSPLSGTFFFPFIFISWRLITLQYWSGFCHTLTWISHGVTCVPHPDPPSHIPPHPIPLGLPIVPAPLYQPWALVHASNLGWRSVSPLIVYLFQCYSLRTSHPCLSRVPKSVL